ncbi:DNA-processing protein DprA [Oceanobacter mangrovi]|uniref:DNA-processing protein DprA n=1 Tax=Oceanobacter mangrovi TaxID=2862510 RepID=UPI001C8CF3AF|nr:DNA-processing protein DprA [Oceanobacter mangrovi]
MDELLAAWWRLHQVRGVGQTTLYHLRDALGGMAPLAQLSADQLVSHGLSAAAVQAWQQQPLTKDFEQLQQWPQTAGQQLLLWQQGDYPEALASLADAPLWLFAKGNTACLDQPMVAIVGSRNPTPYGRDWARQCAYQLARAGICVVSGMALGIDAAAHEGALEAGGSTIAVLGCGADVVYPKRHKQMYEQIQQHGLILSELPPGTLPLPSFFPGRNRIVSGLVQAVVVVEAALKSGSLITARLAAEQGRDVMAVPGAVNNPLAQGCHQLIRDGALLVRHAADVIEELGLLQLQQTPASTSTAPQATPDLVSQLDYGSVTSLDVLAIRTARPVSELMVNLLELELDGWLRQEPGGYRRLK